MMLSIGNGILSWSEQWVPSGLAALIISVTPIWFLLIELWILPNGFRVSLRALTGIVLGATGIVILLWPQLRHAGSFGHRELIGSLALIVGAFSWALGSVFSSRWKLNVDPLTAAGYEMSFAGIGLALAGTLAGDWSRVQFSARGWSALIYLVIFGSWVGFSSYVWLLNHVSTTKVSTYAYVNPMVAVFLGWLVLHEQITSYILAGSVIVVVAVALVTSTKLKENVTSCEESGDRAIVRSGD
jgi:drug/metabolite transporter (DMT)-like permease